MKNFLREFLIACWDTIRLPFWMIKVGWRKLLSFGPQRIGLVLMATVVVTVVAMTAFVKVTSQPGFCKSCHVMEPYFDAWETSTHHNVTCTDCHIPPGFEGTVHSKFMALSMIANYFTGVYKRSKPWAEIDDASCLREGCHDTRLLQSTEFYRGVEFDHQPHLTEIRRHRQLRCTSCHSQIVQGEHISVSQSTCFLCHFRPDSLGEWSSLANCTGCHNPPVGAAAADTSFDHTEMLARNADCTGCHATAVSGDGFVPKERCNSCHAQVAHIERYDDLEFVHQMHVTDRKIECTQCHIEIRHGREAMAIENAARECNKCHGGPENAIEMVWEGKLPGLPESPSSMARAGMTCSSCHTGDIHAQKAARPSPTCTPCHDQAYDLLWTRWEEPLERRIEELKKRAATLDEGRRDTLLHALALYLEGNPLHNPELAEVFAAQMQLAPRRNESGNCISCHPSAGDALALFGGKTFDHRRHVKQSCETCHDVNGERHGHLILTRSQCNDCHHQPVETGREDCAACHQTQQQVYKGQVPQFAGAAPSAMWQADVTCTDCHDAGHGKVGRPQAESCTGCHDEAYADTLTAWLSNGAQLNNQIQRTLQQYRPGTELQKKYSQLAQLLRQDGSSTAHNPELFRAWYESVSKPQ